MRAPDTPSLFHFSGEGLLSFSSTNLPYSSRRAALALAASKAAASSLAVRNWLPACHPAAVGEALLCLGLPLWGGEER